MARPMTVTGSIVIQGTPAELYALVSDPTATSRWSPENLGATVPGALTVGSVFVGHNRRHGVRWSTECVVTAAEVDRRFAFQVRKWGLGRTPWLATAVASWEYRLAPTADGTEVTETWIDDRRGWPDTAAAIFDRIATRTTFAAFQERNITISLKRLQAVVEGAAEPPGPPGREP